MNRFKSIPVHPLLFTLFPVIHLYAHNIEEQEPANVLLLCGLTLAVTCVLTGLLALVQKSRLKGALTTTGFIIIFFSYGHIGSSLRDSFDPGYARHYYMPAGAGGSISYLSGRLLGRKQAWRP